MPEYTVIAHVMASNRYKITAPDLETAKRTAETNAHVIPSGPVNNEWVTIGKAQVHVEPSPRKWANEFPDAEVPDDVVVALEANGFVDDSWHNDICPKWAIDIDSGLETGDEPQIVAWVDYAKPKLREFPDKVRYALVLSDPNQHYTLCETNSEEVFINHLNNPESLYRTIACGLPPGLVQGVMCSADQLELLGKNFHEFLALVNLVHTEGTNNSPLAFQEGTK